MKTTAGKTKTVPRSTRLIHIYEQGHRGLIATRQAASLRAALQAYFDEHLKPKGWKGGKIVGNTLQVKNKAGTKLFRALETTQKP